MLRGIFSFFLSLPENPVKGLIRDIFYGEVISERIFEYAMVLSHLKLEPSKRVKILDVGCYYSNFPLQLASMGFFVWGLDLQPYPFTHPNLRFIQGDITNIDLGKNRFDIITCISTLEHIGLGVYGDKVAMANDLVAVENMHKLLKSKGRLILTVPFGKRMDTKTFRSYDYKALTFILKSFTLKDQHFFMKRERKWFEAPKSQVEKADNRRKAFGVAFVEAQKR